jgi:riboflavin kinase / FMN adenylyltransferase
VNGATALDRGGRGTLVAIGNFDGVHRGHQEVLRQTVERSAAEGLLPVVLTFDPHPARILGRTPPSVLTPLPRKAELLRAQAPSLQVVAQPFDAAFAAQEPEDFARHFLKETLGARWVVVGQNFRFGRARAGDFDALRALGAALGFSVSATPVVGDARGRWSSTRVRAALASGDLEDANDVLGRPHELSGVVIEGQRRGRTIGFPTANLGGVPQAIPAYGVYAVEAYALEGGSGSGAAGGGAGEGGTGRATRLGGGVANIGVRPTLAAGFSVEVHLFDFDGDLYGKRLRVGLVSRLREERTFGSFGELTAQIGRDAEEARRRLEERAGRVDGERATE